MKKKNILFVTIIVTCLAGLSGCGDKKNNEKETSNSTKQDNMSEENSIDDSLTNEDIQNTSAGDGITKYRYRTVTVSWGQEKKTTEKPEESDELRIVNVNYNYYHYDNTYTDGSKGIDSVDSGENISKNVAKHTFSSIIELPEYSAQDIGNKQMYGGKGRTGEHACSYNWYVWFLKDVTYTYQVKDKIEYSEWSEWSEEPVEATDTVEVETMEQQPHTHIKIKR